jgi:hypothetical protein
VHCQQCGSEMEHEAKGCGLCGWVPTDSKRGVHWPAVLLLAALGASVDDMFAAAKMGNRFWFAQQTLETAVFFQETMDLVSSDFDPRMAVGPEVFSRSGHRFVNQWLADNGITREGSGGDSCGV